MYNWGHRGSYVGLGAFIENVTIAASSEGFSTKIDLFPDANDTNYVARIELSEQSVSKDSLSDFIDKRVTNRKPYKKEKITTEEKSELQ